MMTKTITQHEKDNLILFIDKWHNEVRTTLKNKDCDYGACVGKLDAAKDLIDFLEGKEVFVISI